MTPPTPTSGCAVIGGKPAWRRDAVLRLLAGAARPLTTAAVAQALGWASSTASSALSGARKLGLVQSSGDPRRGYRWTITDAGQAAVPEVPA